MWKHQSNFRNLFKISNKDTRMTTVTSFWCFCQLSTDFTNWCHVSIVKFEQVNTRWVLSLSQGICMGELGLIFFTLFFEVSQRVIEATSKFLAFLMYRKVAQKINKLKTKQKKQFFILVEMPNTRYIFLHFSQKNIICDDFFATILASNVSQNCSIYFSLKVLPQTKRLTP